MRTPKIVIVRDLVYVPRPSGGAGLGEATTRLDTRNYPGLVLRVDAALGIEVERGGAVSLVPWPNVAQVIWQVEESKAAAKR